MEKCKIYTFDKDYSNEREDVERQIGIMLNSGWKTKCISSVIGGTTHDEMVLTVIYEKEDKAEEKRRNID